MSLTAEVCAAASLLVGACANLPDDRDLYVHALDASLTAERAVERCRAIRQEETGDECLAELARQREEVGDLPCGFIRSDSWRQECHFAVAEHRAARGDRWAALIDCGEAGAYMNECLYHVWTRELQNLATTPAEGNPGQGLASTVEQAQEIVAYYAQSETCGPDQEERVWGDFWYFYWLHHRPAELDACARLPTPQVARCERGTHLFVERALAGLLTCRGRSCDLLDRTCRSGDIPSSLLFPYTGGDPRLRPASERALARLCDPQTRDDQPWNPIFQRRPFPIYTHHPTASSQAIE